MVSENELLQMVTHKFKETVESYERLIAAHEQIIVSQAKTIELLSSQLAAVSKSGSVIDPCGQTMQ